MKLFTPLALSIFAIFAAVSAQVNHGPGAHGPHEGPHDHGSQPPTSSTTITAGPAPQLPMPSSSAPTSQATSSLPIAVTTAPSAPPIGPDMPKQTNVIAGQYGLPVATLPGVHNSVIYADGLVVELLSAEPLLLSITTPFQQPSESASPLPPPPEGTVPFPGTNVYKIQIQPPSASLSEAYFKFKPSVNDDQTLSSSVSMVELKMDAMLWEPVNVERDTNDPLQVLYRPTANNLTGIWGVLLRSSDASAASNGAGGGSSSLLTATATGVVTPRVTSTIMVKSGAGMMMTWNFQRLLANFVVVVFAIPMIELLV
ncbi:hypothetical protein HDV05_006691 [Chytridiales sp. JEL 0842]|nr:hypothetical protein HDV05_006691 [Chytridiales sp. JEL 0842]